jgi:hypothetical protein
MLGIRALATFLRLWHDLMRVAYDRRRRVIAKITRRVRWQLRVKHYSVRTEQAYVDWIRRYILFHRKRHPNEMGT